MLRKMREETVLKPSEIYHEVRSEIGMLNNKIRASDLALIGLYLYSVIR